MSLGYPLNLKKDPLNVDKKKRKKNLYINWQIVHLCDYHKLYDNDYLIALGASH